MNDCFIDHENINQPETMLEERENTSTAGTKFTTLHCAECGLELVPNNNADPTPYSEAP